MDKFKAPVNVAFFVQEKTGSIYGKWNGKLSAKEQREMFGSYIGKGTFYIDGSRESVEVAKTVCFGTDWETILESSFADVFDKAAAKEAARGLHHG